jgi:hypothetical protein
MRSLTEGMNDADGSQTLNRIVDLVKILGAAIRKMMEAIRCLDGRFTALFEAEDQINPLMKMFTDVWTLQGLSVFCNEDMRVALGPFWQLYVIDGFSTTLLAAKVVFVHVGKELRKVEEFRRQLTHITAILLRCRDPRLLDRVE